MAKLTLKQSLFAAEYLKSGNAADAARQAGYSSKTAREQGYDLLTRPHIQAHITVLKAEIDAEKKWDAVYVLEQLKTTYEAAIEANNLSAASSLLTTMAKSEGLLSDKLELTGRQQISFNIKTGKKPK